ncbi:helix-turn-helix transcriptional regulator [Halosolutus amylolyticus]|uniref:Helix-turn-helix transcriptional regulator n=1 Tax=Halosolutus amylolyticus TaxID=2932267 RepID=A0ABD5PKS9_9EURY|nr:MarR family transcriptional regulator [Halosolutus amylolyticus]
MTDEQDRGIGYLSGSPARVDVLDRLTDEPAQPADLVSFADVSRTTVHRTLGELTDRGWVARVDGGYTATAAGELALETYRQTRTRFGILDRVEPFLSRVDVDAAALEVDWFHTAELATATETNPHRPIEWYADRIAAAVGDDDRLRGVSPVINRQFLTIHAPVIRSGTPTSLVLGESTFEVAAERYADRFRQSLSLDHYDLYVTDDDPSMGLALVGETVFLGACDDSGHLVVALESTDPRLRAWATRRYRNLQSAARRIDAIAIDEPA